MRSEGEEGSDSDDLGGDEAAEGEAGEWEAEWEWEAAALDSGWGGGCGIG